MRRVMTMKVVCDRNGRRTGYEESGEALFHQWGVDFEEFETGAGNYTVAVVERPGGTVELLPVHLIRFLDEAPDFPIRRTSPCSPAPTADRQHAVEPVPNRFHIRRCM